MENTPYLSICIPSYNGARFLERVLEALLPQTLEANGQVEVIVIDDDSTDNTGEVVENVRKHGPVRYIRNPTNLGIARNIVSGPVQHASGEYVWVWSEHCLIFPGALRKILQLLSIRRRLDVIYVNFRCASYPQDWPAAALGGYAGSYQYIGNDRIADRDVARWDELISAKSGACTQSYAHIARRSVWRKYWTGREIGPDLTGVLTTFPHTCTVAETNFDKPTYYFGEPVLTIYNGAQRWSSLDSRAKAFLQGFPELVVLYERLGCSKSALVECKAFAVSQVEEITRDLLKNWDRQTAKLLVQSVRENWRFEGIATAVWRGFVASECCWPARMLSRLGRLIHRTR
ncbi:MAG TPA: glycosyltransferase family 2 protein [Verrucomicrobiae bacterium]